MKCKVQALGNIRVQDVTIPVRTELVIEGNRVKVWVRGVGAPVDLGPKQVRVVFDHVAGTVTD